MAWEERESVEDVIKRQLRPTPVLVIAILHFTLGGISLFMGMCALGMQIVVISNVLPTGPKPPPGTPQPMTQTEIQQFLEQQIPYYRVTLFGTMAYDLLLSTLMIIAGFGLLQMKRWGRNLSIFYAFLSIAQKLFLFVHTLFFLAPAMNEVYTKMFERMGPAGQPFGGIAKMGGTMTTASAFVQLTYMVYPIAVLVIMFLPTVAAQFRGETVGVNEPDPFAR